MTYIPDDLRQLVFNRAGNCCEYCLIPQTQEFFRFEIDHIRAVRHGGTTDEDNLCLACMHCNRHKGTDFASFDPLTGELAFLYNPRRDTWSEHLPLKGATLEPLTPMGRVTVYLLNLNEPARLRERQVLIEIGQYPC